MKPPLLAGLLDDCPIFVTGMGAFSAAGEGVPALWQSTLAGRSTAARQAFVGESGTAHFTVCAAPDIDLTRPELRATRKMDRCVPMACLAANEAWQQARLAGAYPPERIGVMIGSSRGPLGKWTEGLHHAGERRTAPSAAANTTFASVSGAVARSFGCRGPGAMVSATCASAAFAIALAAEQIVLGHADAMLVDGTEAALQPAVLAQMQAAGVLGSHEIPAQSCRPFDVTRNGLVLGEGSAFLSLESAAAVADRRAPVLARLAGWATRTDDSGRAAVHPQGAGLARVMRRSLEIAGLTPDRVGYVNAHGTGTPQNDRAEARAVAGLFGAAVPCTSTKPITGHCLGATPALESILCIETLRQQMIPPTANCHAQDPECAINAAPLQAQPARVSAVISNALGFWGYQASLLFSAEN